MKTYLLSLLVMQGFFPEIARADNKSEEALNCSGAQDLSRLNSVLLKEGTFSPQQQKLLLVEAQEQYEKKKNNLSVFTSKKDIVLLLSALLIGGYQTLSCINNVRKALGYEEIQLMPNDKTQSGPVYAPDKKILLGNALIDFLSVVVCGYRAFRAYLGAYGSSSVDNARLIVEAIQNADASP